MACMITVIALNVESGRFINSGEKFFDRINVRSVSGFEIYVVKSDKICSFSSDKAEILKIEAPISVKN